MAKTKKNSSKSRSQSKSKTKSKNGTSKKTTNKNKQRKQPKSYAQSKKPDKPKTERKSETKKIKVKKITVAKKEKPILKVSPVTLHDGDTAPDFSVKDHLGTIRSLSDYNNKKLVLYFYPKDLTPGCTVEACDFRDSLNRLKNEGVEVLGVSMDDERLHQKFIDKHGLNFPLLSDTSGKLCYDYGVLKEKNNYGKVYVGIVRKTFIIEDKKILKVYPLVRAEGHVQQIINDLASL